METDLPYSYWQLCLEKPRDSTHEVTGTVKIEVLGTQGQLQIALTSEESTFLTDEYRGWLWWRSSNVSPVDVGIVPLDQQGQRTVILPFSVDDIFNTGNNLDDLEGVMISHQGFREKTTEVILAAQMPEE